MWRCKQCSETVSTRYQLLKHYKLKHYHFGQRYSYPCTYYECPCSFKTWNALKTHLSRCHVDVLSTNSAAHGVFTCLLCPGSEILSSREYFSHINNHLKRFETVTCVFQNCTYQTNIYASYKSHKNRKHPHCTDKDFKGEVVKEGTITDDHHAYEDCSGELGETVSDLNCHNLIETDTTNENLEETIVKKLASVLLKLELFSHLPCSAIDGLLEELHFILTSAALPVSQRTAFDIFTKHNLQVDQLVINELSVAISTNNPLVRAIAKGGPLASSFKRKQYYKENFKVVEPVEYVLEARSNKTFQYVPLLNLLQQLLARKDIVDKLVDHHTTSTSTANANQYACFQDGEHHKKNSFFGEDLRISLCFYIDDFEICNPLGTSRKKHKLCAVYWILGNLPPGCSSALSSIYLALLCKSDYVKTFGYEKIFEPLLHDLKILEQQGIYIPQLGVSIKGTIQCVVADNLGSHGLAGFVESFSAKYFCRFCTAQLSEIQTKEVKTGVFKRRTKEIHEFHVKTAQEEGINCFGVRKSCILTNSLSHFNVTTGYPPDIVHDIFEGIVPVELARCIGVLISKKLFTLDHLNSLIHSFPYKEGDKTNRPHLLPKTFQKSHTVGGNAHENWCLLRLFPFIVGELVPNEEPAWQVILDLKDIAELVVAPVHSPESIAYLESKISDHRKRYQELFPEQRLLPKHHFLEHYPEMIKCFGPLVSLWTMRFEAKHSFFKQVVRHLNNFRNITLSLATKHQLMIAHHLLCPDNENLPLDVSKISEVPIDVLNDDVVNMMSQKYPEITTVNIAQSATVNGIKYKKGMIVVHGSCGSLPEFSEIIQLCIIKDDLSLIIKKLTSWYRDHYRAFELHPTRQFIVVGLKELSDQYPLVDYRVGTLRMVTLKRFVHVTGNFFELNIKRKIVCQLLK